MLNPEHPVVLSIAGSNALRNGLFKSPWISYRIDSLTNSGWPRENVEEVQALTRDLEHCRVTLLVVVFESRLV